MKNALKIVLFLLVMGATSAAQARPPTVDPMYGLPVPPLKPPIRGPDVEWIWADHTAGTQTVLARRLVTLTRKPRSASMAVTADDCFTVSINGRLADASPPNMEQGWKHVHHVNVTNLLRAGKNVVSIRGFNSGGAAGILALLNVDGVPALWSDSHWKALEASAEPAGWKSPAFNDGAWPPATVIAPVGAGPWSNALDGWPGLTATAWYLLHRPAYPTAVDPVSSAQTIAGAATLVGADQGHLVVRPVPSGGAAPSVLVDFGEERAGRIELRGTDGAKVTVTTGESREECFHAEPALDNRGPAELTLSQTKAAATAYSAFRYALLTFSGAQPVTLTRVVCDQKYYPVRYKGAFDCADPLLTRIWYAGAYTAHLCMQEDIWDAPKRDRGLWCGDLQVTGQTINDVFADKFLMEQSIRELREISQAGRPDTALPASEINDIPGYSAAWFCELADFHRHRGDYPFLRSQHDKIISLLEFQKTDFDRQDLFTNPHKKWAFCDWAPGFVINTPQTLTTTDLFIIKGVREAVFLLRELGDGANAEKYMIWADALTAAARRNFVAPGASTYGDRLQENAMAVYSGVVTPPQRAAVYSRILAGGSPIWRPTTPLTGTDDEVMSPYYGYFVLSDYGLMGHNQDGLDLIRRYWGEMLRRGAGTCWEKFDPRFPKNFGPLLDMMPYLSLCHGWSSGPTSYLTEYVLGVRPTSGGFRTVEIAPDLADLYWVTGDVPAPQGTIHVRAAKRGTAVVVGLTLPAHMDAEVTLAGRSVTLNGRPAAFVRRGRGKLSFHVTHAGAYRIVAAP